MITKEILEKRQIGIYIVTLLISAIIGLNWGNSKILETLSRKVCK